MKIARGGFQRWPRQAQTAYVQVILLLGIALGAAGGTLALFVACATTFALWLRYMAKSRRKSR